MYDGSSHVLADGLFIYVSFVPILAGKLGKRNPRRRGEEENISFGGREGGWRISGPPLESQESPLHLT